MYNVDLRAAVPFEHYLHTNGEGLWSDHVAEVITTEMELIKINGMMVGELRVYFDFSKWLVEEHSIIYTDPLFIQELNQVLNGMGFKGEVDYSESGMQGPDYVSLDCGEDFVLWFTEKYLTCK